jgi:Toprim domain
MTTYPNPIDTNCQSNNKDSSKTDELSFSELPLDANNKASFDFQTLRRLSKGSSEIDVPCPICGPNCKTPSNKVRKVLRIYNKGPHFTSYYCARCGVKGFARGLDTNSLYNNPVLDNGAPLSVDNTAKARWLWQHSQSIVGSPAETYLRKRRHISCPLPATLGFLPSHNNHYHPALIAIFGDSTDIVGVHLTKLRPDGSDKAGTDSDKIMIGSSMGQPIIVAPHDDDTLIISEGIEDGLTAHQATGYGAWAAGSASRLPALADVVPSSIKLITVIVDNDEAGSTNSTKLIQKLITRACFEVRVCVAEETK